MSRKITDEDLLEELQKLGEQLGKTPTAADMNERGSYSASACQNHFGTWNNALEAAGYVPKHEREDSPDRGELLTELSELAERLGRSPLMEDMDAQGEYSAKLYSTRFESWNEALREAGLETNVDVGLSSEELISDLKEFTANLGKTPTRREMNQMGPHSPRPYSDRYGSWNESLREAGLDPNHAAHRRDSPISEEELLDELERLTEVLGHPPTGPEMQSVGKFSSSIYQRKFETWNEALRTAGLELHDNKGTPDTKLLGEIHRLVDELGRVPSATEMRNMGDYTHATYQSRFGSWSEAVREAGYEPVWGQSGFPSGKDHPGWRGGHKRYYGPSWNKQRKQRLEKDNKRCQNCGMENLEHINEFGYSLHVHHIVPFRKFGVENHREANRLDNLITLCHDCHIVYEGTGLKPDNRTREKN